MDVAIQGYWNAEVKTAQSPSNGAEEKLKRGEKLTICDVLIDGKLVGSVTWNGTTLDILPP